MTKSLEHKNVPACSIGFCHCQRNDLSTLAAGTISPFNHGVSLSSYSLRGRSPDCRLCVWSFDLRGARFGGGIGCLNGLLDIALPSLHLIIQRRTLGLPIFDGARGTSIRALFGGIPGPGAIYSPFIAALCRLRLRLSGPVNPMVTGCLWWLRQTCGRHMFCFGREFPPHSPGLRAGAF